MRRRRLARQTILAASLVAFSSKVLAQEIVLLDRATVDEAFAISLAVAIEYLEAQSPPRYRLNKVTVTYAITSGLDANVSGKLPALAFNAEVTGKYQDLATITETRVYTPATLVPTNFDDRGLLRFIDGIHAEMRQSILSQSPFIPTMATLEQEFFIQMDIEAKLKFLSVLSVDGSANLKNKHAFKFEFCLAGDDGNCS